MRRFQKVFYALAAVVALGWFGASTASAQVQFFVSSSSPRQVRGEGLSEAVGTIAFAANSTGTLPLGSTFTLDYGTVVQPTASGGTTPWGTLTETCTGAALGATVSGNVVTLTVTTAGLCNSGETISFAGARVNANALGASASVNVTVGAVSTNQATQPITLISVGTLTVGTVQAIPSTTTAFTAGSAAGVILLCGPSLKTVSYTITEKFASAFLSSKNTGTAANGDENTLSTGGTFANSKIRFSITGLPIGVRVAMAIDPTTSDSLDTAAGAGLLVTGAFTSSSGSQDVDMEVTFGAAGGTGLTSTTTIETLVVTFTFDVPDLSKLTTTEATGNVKIQLKGASSAPDAPTFASNTQLSGSVIRVLACASYLLFPWVAYTADGTLDTGIAISNTTADPAVIGTLAQTGDVTLYFWTADGSTPPPALKIGTAVKGGQSSTFVASSIGKAFTGYIIAHCTFQMGHGLAAFLSPRAGVFGASYLAISLSNPRLSVIDQTTAESRAH